MPPRRSLRNSSSAAATPQKPSPRTASAPQSRSTPKSSKYFSNPNGKKRKAGADSGRKRKSPGADELSEPESSSPSAEEAESSGYEDEEDNDSEPTSDDEDDNASNEWDSDDAPPAKKRKQATKGKPTPRTSLSKTTPTSAGAKGKELWRPGVKTGLGPGTQVVIDKPKARAAGKTPYTDDTIHPNTMLFLSELADNNDREWLKMHDPDYRTSWKDFTSFLEALQQRLGEVDETIPELPTKDVVFRIYRDIRFTPDPTPYKTHFSAAFSRTGRKGPYACYYVQVKPGGSFVGGGLWHPEAQPVALIRRDIDRHPDRLKAALKSTGFRKEFLGGVGADDKKVVKAFVAHNGENALKTKPRDYAADHPDIDLLRLKNFTIGRRLADDEVLGPKGIDRFVELMACMVPFVTYLNNTVMPDEEASESDEDEDADDAGASDS